MVKGVIRNSRLIIYDREAHHRSAECEKSLEKRIKGIDGVFVSVLAL